jgi:hypothetical protein
MHFLNYLDFFCTSFLSFAVLVGTVALASCWFLGRHPQPQDFFSSAMLITSFLVKYFRNNLIKVAKKRAYFSNSILPTLSRTMLSSFCSSISYFFSASKLALCNSFSLNLPVPWHPHEQTSFNTSLQPSMASSFIEYGIQYPFLSLLTKPACFNILRCCDIAGGVRPRLLDISLTPRGPWALRSSIILTRVSTLNTLNNSAGSMGIRQTY